MKHTRPISLLALAALASCALSSSDSAAPPDPVSTSRSNISTNPITGEESAKLVGGTFVPGVLTAENDTMTRPLPDDTQTDGRVPFDGVAAFGDGGDEAACSVVCAGVLEAGNDACKEFGVKGPFCGMASAAVCLAVCNSSRYPISHCSTHAGGKACMNRNRFWWCDTAVDGNKVRARYELDALDQPGIVPTAWAPSKGCIAVRNPTAGWVKRWQVCTENLGCSAWFYPNHENATLQDYIPVGTPPDTEAPEAPDVTPPSVSVGGWTPGQWYAGAVPIVASAWDSENPVSAITVYVNDQPIYSAAGGSVAFTWDSSGYNGETLIKAAATDAAGNTGWTYSRVYVSNRPPTAALTVPGTVSSQVWFECSVGGAGPTTKTVLVDGSEIWQGDWGWNSRGVADGAHTVTCRATDVMGRVVEQAATVYVYNTPGGLSWIYPHFQTFTAAPGNSIMEISASLDETDLDLGEIYEDGHASTCRAPHDPNAHSAMTLDCDGAGPGNRGIELAGRPEGVLHLTMHAHESNPYQHTEGNYWYGRTVYLDNTPPVIVVDPAASKFVEVDGLNYLHLEATTPVPLNFYAATPDSITSVEFFVRLEDGTSKSLGAVTTGYPWTLQVRVPDHAIIDSSSTVYAVATDTVYAHVDTPVHRTGTSSDVTITRPTPDPLPAF